MNEDENRKDAEGALDWRGGERLELMSEIELRARVWERLELRSLKIEIASSRGRHKTEVVWTEILSLRYRSV